MDLSDLRQIVIWAEGFKNGGNQLRTSDVHFYRLLWATRSGLHSPFWNSKWARKEPWQASQTGLQTWGCRCLLTFVMSFAWSFFGTRTLMAERFWNVGRLALLLKRFGQAVYEWPHKASKWNCGSNVWIAHEDSGQILCAVSALQHQCNVTLLS